MNQCEKNIFYYHMKVSWNHGHKRLQVHFDS